MMWRERETFDFLLSHKGQLWFILSIIAKILWFDFFKATLNAQNCKTGFKETKSIGLLKMSRPQQKSLGKFFNN